MFTAPDSPLDDCKLADWVELELLFGNPNSFSRTDLRGRLAADLEFADPIDDYLVQDEEQLGAEQMAVLLDDEYIKESEGLDAVEVLVQQGWDELHRRKSLLGDLVPYEIDTEVVSMPGVWEDVPIYAFFSLLCSRLHYETLRESLKPQTPAVLFELLATVALGKYIGGSASRFGWPRNNDGEESKFEKAVDNLAANLNEYRGPARSVPPKVKDHDLDVIAWKSFVDGESSQAIILCQCAIGSDWTEKGTKLGLWETDVLNLAVTPLRALAFADNAQRYDETKIYGQSRIQGVLLDRMRLLSLIELSSVEPGLVTRLRSWITDSIIHLPVEP